ncbi:MAG TPA: hypothetical protein DD761_20095, partial [Cyanobacteria bacterium UBA11691]|nr:hypothetical protein [Cyanobacteria bacterium UBA11691]
AQIHGYLQQGLRRMPLNQRQEVGKKFIQLWCETCTKEDDCPILFGFICDRNITEWKVSGGFPFCEQYNPVGEKHE